MIGIDYVQYCCIYCHRNLHSTWSTEIFGVVWRGPYFALNTNSAVSADVGEAFQRARARIRKSGNIDSGLIRRADCKLNKMEIGKFPKIPSCSEKSLKINTMSKIK